MNDQDPITESLDAIGASLRQHPSVKHRVEQRIAAATADGKSHRSTWSPGRRLTALVGLAACLALAATAWHVLGGNGAAKAFADAFDSLRQARTFSCKQIHQFTQDGQEHVMEHLFMFKEPELSRDETLSGFSGQDTGDVTIQDYAQRRRLDLSPSRKMAWLRDMSADFEVDDNTGQLRLTQLDTSLREQLLRYAAGEGREVEDLGTVELEDRSVRMLRSQRGNAVVTAWVDPRTHLPVRLEIQQPRQLWTYASIKIDEPLDDSLFRLEPPEGHTLKRQGWSSVRQKKLLAKMRYLLVRCVVFRSRNRRFCEDLADLTTVGVKPEVLRAVLAAPDQPDGPPAIRCRRPDETDPSRQVLLYEVYDEHNLPDEGIVVCMSDGGIEIIPKELIEQFMR